jgi:hypothetical protein
MGHYFSEMRTPTLEEELEAFASDNKDRWFILCANDKNNALKFKRSELVAFLSKYRKDHKYLGQIRALFHELSK